MIDPSEIADLITDHPDMIMEAAAEAVEIDYSQFDPDALYIHDSITFVFTPNKQLHWLEYDFTHTDLLSDKEIQIAIYGDYRKDETARTMRRYAQHRALLGRIGETYGNNIISFWNTQADLYQQLLKPCLKEILRVQEFGFVVDDSAIVVTPIFNPTTVAEMLGTEPDEQEEQEIRWKQELWEKLHLMPPAQKKEAMQKLGLGRGGKEGPWTKAWKSLRQQTDDPRYLYPPWRATSEGKDYLIEQIAKSIPANPELISEAIHIDTPTLRNVDPDYLYDTDSTAFIYAPDHKLYCLNFGDYPPSENVPEPENEEEEDLADEDEDEYDYYSDDDHETSGGTHHDLLRTKAVQESIWGDFKPHDEVRTERLSALMQGALLGRIGAFEGKEVISFWNTNFDHYNNYLMEAIAAILENGLTDDTAMVVTPIHDPITIAEIPAWLGKEKKEDPEIRWKQDLWQKLHLMPPKQKKEAMQKLGLGRGSREKPIVKAWKSLYKQTEDPRYLYPSWRATSESQQ